MISIACHGHPNIVATHPTTLEITASENLTTNGDCIIGVGACFDQAALGEFLATTPHISVSIDLDGDVMSFRADANPDFTDNKELVFRRSDFVSSRTVGVHASMACIDLPRDFVQKLKNPSQIIFIHIEAAT